MSRMRIWFAAEMADVGPILALLAGRAKDVNFEVIVDTPAGRGRPRLEKSTTEFVLDQVRQAPGISGGTLRSLAKENGHKVTGVAFAIKSLLKSKDIRRGPKDGKSFTYTAVAK